MPPDFRLRPGRAEDFEFAQTLYFSSMKPLLEALDAWNSHEADAAFTSYFDIDEIRVIMIDDADVGWIQVSETEHELCIDQLHLLEPARGHGIGTTLIKATIAEAIEKNKNVSLSLVKGNRAIRLYERLGFQRVAEDRTKIHKLYVVNQVK